MLHEELWRYHDDHVTAVVFRQTDTRGELIIHTLDRDPLHRAVPLTQSSPTTEDDEDWMTQVLNHIEEPYAHHDAPQEAAKEDSPGPPAQPRS